MVTNDGREGSRHEADVRSKRTDRDYVDQILDQWSRERPDLDTSPMGIVARVWRLARLSEALSEENFAQHGLSRGGFDVLAALRRAGAPYQLSPSSLYSSLLISSGAMTNRIDRLVELGLVERVPDAGDRRGIKVVLTVSGKAVIDDAVRDHVDNERRMLDVFSTFEVRILPKLLRVLLLRLGDLASAADDSDGIGGCRSRLADPDRVVAVGRRGFRSRR